MKEYTSILKSLYDSISLENQVDALVKVAAIEHYSSQLSILISEKIESREADYLNGKLDYFSSYCFYAVAYPDSHSHRTATEWFEDAGAHLANVASRLPHPM